VLWDRDDRLARPLLERFWAEGDLIVGANEPYSGRLEGDCLWQHASKRGLVHALIEVRQDLIRDASGQRAWAERICRIMQTVLGEKLPLLRGLRTAPLGDFEGAARAGEAFQHRAYNNGDAAMMNEDKASTIECEAAAFRRLLQHLRERTDVQNIDLMNLAGFCRNCLANWYQEAATAAGLKLSKDGARELIYGMPYKEWQAEYLQECTAHHRPP